MSYDKVDWSVAPADATHWEMTEVGRAVWSQEQLFENGKGNLVRGRFACEGDREFAPDFGFSGDYRNSLTSRPGRGDVERYQYDFVAELLHGVTRQKALDMKYVLTTLQARLRENRLIDNSERLLLLNLVNASLI
ncbi:TPA: hypothetical protein ONA83_003532 [Pseudomonas aeruginosa]|nr:hypothetical protein [Pseudomonas aeruginosa]